MTDSFQRRTNLSFAPSEKDSPTKTNNVISPNNTAGSKKGLFGGFFAGKKKPAGDSNALSPAQKGDEIGLTIDDKINNAPQAKSKTKHRMLNKKNIADGKVRLNVIDNDRVPEDYQIEYKDDPFEVLDHNPTRTTSYIENLKSRMFTQINNRDVKRFVELQQIEKEVAPPINVENLELDLFDIQDSYEKFFTKFYRFFQGLLSGYTVVNLFLVFGGSDDQTTILNNFVSNSLRVNQIFYLISLISVLGALHRYVETKAKYNETLHATTHMKDALNKQTWKYLIASICFGVVYVLVVFNHEAIAILSSSGVASITPTRFNVFRILSAIAATCAIIGWLVLTLAFEEVSVNNHDTDAYQQALTGDMTHEEDDH